MARLVVLIAALLAVAADEPALKPDPPAKPVAWPARLPEVEFRGRYPTLLLADHTGPFVMAWSSDGKATTRTVFDLRTGKQLASWKADHRPGWPQAQALSPDGKLLVATTLAGEHVPGQPDRPSLAGFDAATGEQLWAVPLTAQPNQVRFAGTDRVAVLRGGAGPRGVDLYSARTGKVVREVSLDRRYTSALGVSPGGAYLALPDRAGVAVFATTDGAVVRRFEFPQAGDASLASCREVAFSPDGGRLAALFWNGPAARILCWDLATGKQDADARLPAPTWNSPPLLRWTVNGAAWFVPGIGMIDPDTGAVLWKFSRQPPYPTVLAAVAAHRIIWVINPAQADRCHLGEAALPPDKIAAALKAVRAGGLAVDGWLPTLAKVDRSAAQAVTIPPRADDWTYQPDPAPMAARKPLRLPLPANQVASAHVVGTAAIFELAESTTDLLAPRRLVRVDLATGKPTGRVELPHVARLADVAPDGTAALTVDAEDSRRVDVWDLGTGKHVAGWRPAGVREPGGELLCAALLSADRVLTLTRGGELAVWSVPGAKAVYATRVPGLGVPARSPGRKYLFALQGDAVRVIEAVTGQLVGDLPTDAGPPPTLPLQPGPWSHPSLTVRPDGEELAALIPTAGAGPQVRRWDLTTAKLRDRSAFTGTGISQATAVRYAGPDHLLVAHVELYGLASRSTEWRYVRPAAARPAASADGRYWYVAGEFAHQAAAIVGAGPAWAVPTAVLVAAELPHPTAVAALKAAADNTADNLLGPGKTVGLKLDLTDVPSDKVRESVRATLADALAERGLRATDGKADVVLTASARVTPNGPKLTVRKLLPGEKGTGTAEKVEMPYLATRLELTVAGKSVWTGSQGELPPPLGPQPFRLPDKDTDLTAWLRERVWARLSDAWGKLSLPRTLIRTAGGLVTLPGKSEFGPDGPRPPDTGPP